MRFVSEWRNKHSVSFFVNLLICTDCPYTVLFACGWKGAKRVSHYACDAQAGINHWLLQCNCSACFLSAIVNTMARTTRRTRKAAAFQTMGIILMSLYRWPMVLCVCVCPILSSIDYTYGLTVSSTLYSSISSFSFVWYIYYHAFSFLLYISCRKFPNFLMIFQARYCQVWIGYICICGRANIYENCSFSKQKDLL